MESLTLPGWYCDALPGRRYAALAPGSHLSTERGSVPLPRGQNLLFLVLSDDGAIAGNGHQDDQAWLWDGSEWTAHGLAYGPAACMFDADGILHVVRREQGPVGYRYVAEDGHLVTCEETYADPRRRIWQYTEVPGGITVGQGGDGPHGDDPLIVLHQGRRYRVCDGRCRAIRAHRQGDAIALAWSREDTSEARMLWLDVSEIASFPEDVEEPPPIVVVPPPPEPPNEPPNEPPPPVVDPPKPPDPPPVTPAPDNPPPAPPPKPVDYLAQIRALFQALREIGRLLRERW